MNKIGFGSILFVGAHTRFHECECGMQIAREHKRGHKMGQQHRSQMELLRIAKIVKTIGI